MKYTKDIIVYPEFLDVDRIQEYLQNEISKDIGLCIDDIGYVLDVSDITSYKCIRISKQTGNAIYRATYLLHCVKPTIGMVMRCQVNIISEKGIFGHMYNFNILVPVSELTDWTYTNQTFRNEAHVIQINDWIQVEITKVHCYKQTYGCIGKLNDIII